MSRGAFFRTHSRATVLLTIFAAGCSAGAVEPTPADHSGAAITTRQASQVGGGVLAGYVHTSAKSKFALGSTEYSRSESGLTRTVGRFGAFATHPATGMVTAMSNADSPARGRPPLTGDVQAHNGAVRSYFVTAGLPIAQIESVREQVVMGGGGRDVGADPSPGSLGGARLEGIFSTVFRRTPGGVPVVDSYAWARINVDGDVTMESVYWPELAESVVADADAFSAVLGDAGARAQFLARLAQHPREIREDYSRGQLKVHHSPGTWAGAFEARAVYDIADGDRIAHFDLSGQRVHFRHESAPLPGAAMVKP